MAYVVQVVVAFALSSVLHAATLPKGVANISHLKYATFFWIQGACVLCETALVKAASLYGLDEPRPGWQKIALALIRVTWSGVVLYHTVPFIENELILVSRILGLRPLYFLTLPD